MLKSFVAIGGLLGALVFNGAPAGAGTLRVQTEGGTLVVEVDDAAAEVAVDEDRITISGAGIGKVQLKLGAHLFRQAARGNDDGAEVLRVEGERGVAVTVRAVAAGGRERVRGWVEQGATIDPRIRKALAPPAFMPLLPKQEDAIGKRAGALAVQDRGRDEWLRMARAIAGNLVSRRNSLDERVWASVSRHWTTTEASKLLVAFFRGDGTLPGFSGSPDEARQLKTDLRQLRRARETAWAALASAARVDADEPASPLVGAWVVTEVRGMGGTAADALELYDPDPVPRRFVAANDAAGLLTGAGFWLFDANYPDDGASAIDMSAVVRGDTVYRGRFQIDGDEATLRVSPMNRPRPKSAAGDPTDGGFVLHLRRAG